MTVKVRRLRELDALVAEAFGYRAWLERRGEYELAVAQKPGARAPWENCRPEYQTPERYREVGCSEAQRVGFYAEGFPRYSSSIAAAWEVVERMRAEPLSVRRRFSYFLADLLRTSAGELMAWSDAIFFVEPQHLALAALRAKGVEVELPTPASTGSLDGTTEGAEGG